MPAPFCHARPRPGISCASRGAKPHLFAPRCRPQPALGCERPRFRTPNLSSPPPEGKFPVMPDLIGHLIIIPGPRVIPGLTRNPSSGEGLLSAPTPSPQKTALTAAEPTFRGEGPPPKMRPSPGVSSCRGGKGPQRPWRRDYLPAGAEKAPSAPGIQYAGSRQLVIPDPSLVIPDRFLSCPT